MVQQPFTDMEYANRNRTTKREALPEDRLLHRTDTGYYDTPALSTPAGKA